MIHVDIQHRAWMSHAVGFVRALFFLPSSKQIEKEEKRIGRFHCNYHLYCYFFNLSFYSALWLQTKRYSFI